MKKIIGLIIALCFIFNISTAEAKIIGQTGKSVTFGLYTEGLSKKQIWAAFAGGAEVPYQPTFMSVYDNNGVEHTAFCLNPGRDSGYYTYDNVRMHERAYDTIMETNNINDLKSLSKDINNVYYAGIESILNNGYKGTSVSNKAQAIEYFATDHALRMWHMLWKDKNTNVQTYINTKADSYLLAYNKLLNDQVLSGIAKKTGSSESILTLLNKLENKVVGNMLNGGKLNKHLYPTVSSVPESVTPISDSNSEKFSATSFLGTGEFTGYSYGGYGSSGTDVTTEVETETYDLLDGAIRAAMITADNGVSVVGWSKTLDNPLKSEDGYQVKEIKYKITLHGFGSADALMNAFVEKETNPETASKVSVKLYLNSVADANELTGTENILKKIPAGAKTFDLIVRISALESEYICEYVKHRTILKYKDDTIDDSIYESYATTPGGSDSTKNLFQHTIHTDGSSSTQDKVIGDSSNDDLDYDGSGSNDDGWDKEEICIGKGDCKYIKESCNETYHGSSTSLACQIFSGTYNNKCAVCTLDAILPSCTDVDTELLLNEGTAYDEISENKLDCGSKRPSVMDCVIKGEDPAENSYNAVDLGVSKTNPYCQVYCKEDYHIGLPGIQTANAGRSFQLKASITGGKTCYTGKIDQGKLKNDLNSYKSTMASGDPIAASEANTKYNAAINQYKECFNWNMTYNYNPEIKFEYDETYFDLIKNNKNTFTAFDLETNKSIDTVTPSPVKSYFYFTNNIQDDYCEHDTEGDCAFKDNIADVSKINLTLSDGTIVTGIPSATYVKQESTVDATYATPDHYYAVTSYRTIAVPKSDPPDERQSLQLENQLPIAHNTGIGVYDYSIKINNLGEYYNNDDGVHHKGDLGRIWGDSNSVVNVVTTNINDDSNVHTQCSINQINEKYDGESVDLVKQDSTTSLNNGVYICKYQVNKNDCRIDKDKDGNPVYYLNDEIVTEETYYSQCPGDNICEKSCTYDRENNLYYGSAGTTVDINTFKSQCNDNKPHMCEEEPAGSGNYFGINGEKVSKEQYLRECNSCKKEPDGAGFKYTGLDGNYVSESVYNEQCPKKCQIIGGTHYYYGEVVSQETYNSCCDPCPDCPIEGGGDCEGPDCVPSGGGLIFDDGDLNVNVRPITNENINPNNRPLGNNWAVKDPEITLHPDDHQSELQQDEYALTSALELKAIVATKEIQEAGELIYDTSKEDNQTLTVTLDQVLLRKIVTLNEDAKTNGGYTNNTLDCYDHEVGSGIDKKVYKNVFCYSTFLDQLITEYPDKFVFTIPDGGSRYQTDGERSNSLSSKYWKPWTEVNTSSWSVMTNYDMVSKHDGFGTKLNIGPSWK